MMDVIRGVKSIYNLLRITGRAVGSSVEGGIGRTILDGVASRKVSELRGLSTSDSLLYNGGESALVGGIGGGDGEVGAGCSDSLAGLIVGIVAVIDGILKSSDVPTVLEVSVPSVPSGVTHGVDERPFLGGRIPAAGESVNIPSNLVEELHEADWMGRWACSVIKARQVSNMGSVIGRIEVFTIPASRHVNTGVESCFAIGSWESGARCGVIIASVARAVSQASPLDSALGKLALTALIYGESLGALGWVSANHLEASGERFDTWPSVADV